MHEDNDNVQLTVDIGPTIYQALKDIVFYLNNREGGTDRLASIEQKLSKIQELGETILMTLSEFATRTNAATNTIQANLTTIAATLADLKGQLDPAGKALLETAITNLEAQAAASGAVAAGDQATVPSVPVIPA